MPFALLLGVFVALVDLLPLVGGLLAGVPVVIIAAIHSVPAGIVMLIVFLVYQQIENHVLNPVIMSRTVQLNPFWVLIAVLVGATLGGRVAGGLGTFVGALVGIPVGGAIQVIVRELRRGPEVAEEPPCGSRRCRTSGPSTSEDARRAWAGMDGKPAASGERRGQVRAQNRPGRRCRRAAGLSRRPPLECHSCVRWWSFRRTTSRRTSSGCCTGSTSACPGAGVLVVDDGSPDGTADLVKRVAAELPDVHLLARARRSPGWAARTAPASPGVSSAATTPASRSTPTSRTTPPRCRRWWRRSRRASTSPSARVTSRAGSIPNWAWHRHLLSRGGNVYASAVLGLGVSDSTAGYRAYTAGILRQLDLDRIRAEGYGFQIEMTYRANQHGATITEVPISFVDRAAGESKMSSFIVVEALGLVTWWGLGRMVHGARRVSTGAATGQGSVGRGRRGRRRGALGFGPASTTGTEDPVRSA